MCILPAEGSRQTMKAVCPLLVLGLVLAGCATEIEQRMSAEREACSHGDQQGCALLDCDQQDQGDQALVTYLENLRTDCDRGYRGACIDYQREYTNWIAGPVGWLTACRNAVPAGPPAPATHP